MWHALTSPLRAVSPWAQALPPGEGGASWCLSHPLLPPSAAGCLYLLLVVRGGLGGTGRGRGRGRGLLAQRPGCRHALASACCPQCSSHCVPFTGDELSSGSGPGSSAGPSSLPAPTDAWAMPPAGPMGEGGLLAAVRPGVGSVWLSGLAVLRGVSVSLVGDTVPAERGVTSQVLAGSVPALENRACPTQCCGRRH